MGASLLAIALIQSTSCKLTHRYREQARSHRLYQAGMLRSSGFFGVLIDENHCNGAVPGFSATRHGRADGGVFHCQPLS
ncbi:protein of unknown function [Pseudomonas mediterranea]